MVSIAQGWSGAGHPFRFGVGCRKLGRHISMTTPPALPTAGGCWNHDHVPSLVVPVVAPGQLSGTSQPTLQTGSILLRPWTAKDARAVVAAYQEPEIQRWHARSMTLTEAEQWIVDAGIAWAQESGVSWAVDLEGQLAGRMTLKFYLADAGAGVGYWTRQAARGQGVASQALLVATQWAFDHGIHRVQLEHSTQNPASCRVAAKARFAGEGIRRSAALHADGWHDMHLHGRVNKMQAELESERSPVTTAPGAD
ncbi:hypothetical protein MLP_40110 [Microlunatus phosphovorus NM-1]|uniref:N-acetyltransferase domain-containing protein n=2 Tax=Microlunatus phosphovorus TaxID=29405 RepID=F5XR03_MICPN|nr:hypothetical protein MLP_40110 [Microlunatus phosphovorus NM-1]